MIKVINLAQKFDAFTEHWTPKIIGDVNDFHVKLAKLQGEFLWHQHDDEDELFLVVKGCLRLEMRDRTVDVSEGEVIIIPRGVEHRPSAAAETHVLLFERKTTRHTGNVQDERTVNNPQRI